eukprot:Skav234407  [mRNA]  locus=scaffold873:386296:389720:- [translate_table: standard]
MTSPQPQEIWLLLLRSQGSRSKEAQLMLLEFRSAAVTLGVPTTSLQEVAVGMFALRVAAEPEQNFLQVVHALTSVRRVVRLHEAFSSVEGVPQGVVRLLASQAEVPSWWLELELRESPVNVASLPLKQSQGAEVVLQVLREVATKAKDLVSRLQEDGLQLVLLEANGGRRGCSPTSCLDPCCGSGTLAAMAAASGVFAQVFARDVDEQFLQRARENFDYMSSQTRLTMIDVDLHDAATPFTLALKPDIVIANPPWGWRVGLARTASAEQIACNLFTEFPTAVVALICPELPEELGEFEVKFSCALGQSAVWILSSGSEGEKCAIDGSPSFTYSHAAGSGLVCRQKVTRATVEAMCASVMLGDSLTGGSKGKGASKRAHQGQLARRGACVIDAVKPRTRGISGEKFG